MVMFNRYVYGGRVVSVLWWRWT